MSETPEVSTWAGVIALLGFGGLIAIGNWTCFVGAITTGGGTSFVPLVGGILLSVGIWLLPIEGVWKWAWVGLLIDFGSIPLWAYAGVSILLDKIRNRDA